MLHISRWGWTDTKNDIGVQKVICFTLDNCSVYKRFFLVIFLCTCLLHLYTRYICNNKFPHSIVLDMSCHTYYNVQPEDAKNEVGVRKVRFFTLDNCSVYKKFFWFFSTCLLHMYACYICTNGFPFSIVLDTSCYMF